MLRKIAGAALVAFSLPMLVLASTGVASAHERRNVGPYTFVIGFIVEPALTNEPNGLDLRITNTATNEPVTGAEQGLKFAVTQGGVTKEFPVRSRFGMPGAYTADFIPTKAGQYLFQVTGNINDTPINERFESGPGNLQGERTGERTEMQSDLARGRSYDRDEQGNGADVVLLALECCLPISHDVAGSAHTSSAGTTNARASGGERD